MLGHDCLVLTVFEGRVVGRNRRRRKLIQMLERDDLMGTYMYEEVKRLTLDREHTEID